MKRAFLLAAALIACRTPTGPEVAPPAIPQDCPEAPPVMSVAEAAGELARFARETRANLMARLEPPPAQHEELFATLHPPGLALLEATLASPGKAQKLDPGWMQDHLLKAVVEIHGRKAVAALADGDTRGVVLQDEQGRQTEALYMTVKGSTYRLYFDPLFFDEQRERTLLTFKLPGAAPGEPTAVARWRLSRAMLGGIDELPLLFWMSRARGVRIGRWALLAGDPGQARAVLADELRCAPDLDAARGLLQEMRALARVKPRIEQLDLRRAALPGPLRRELAHNPRRDLALRVALLARISPLASVGVVAPARVKQAQQALRLAARALDRRAVGWDLAARLTDFDRTLATLLARALDGEPAPRAELPTLALRGGPDLPAEQVRAALEQRVLRANYGLAPRWVKGPEGHDTADGRVSRLHLLELEPVLRGEGGGEVVVATAHRRLGWGWIHPGLPPQRYQVRFADNSAAYWARQVQRAGPGATLAAYKPLARQLLERELHSPSPRAARLAMAGLVRLDGPAAVKRLLGQLAQAPPARQAALLQAVALVRDARVGAAIQAATRSGEPVVRAGAMIALGLRAQPAELPRLRAGLGDGDARVVDAALEGLLRAGDPAGLVQARRWLLGQDSRRRELVLALAAWPELKLKGLAAALIKRAAAAAPSPRLPAALVQVLGPRRSAAQLNRIYDRAPGLRLAVVRAAQGPAAEPLFRRALGQGNAELRREAMLGLARLEKPPEGLLQQALADKDGQVKLAAHVGLARLGRAASLLALGQGARASCWERRAVLPTLCRSMEADSRGRLLVDALRSTCPRLHAEAWQLGQRYQPRDPKLLKAALGHPRRPLRVRAALAVLGAPAGPGSRSLRFAGDD